MSKFSYFRIAGQQLDLICLKQTFSKYDFHICKKGESYYNKYTEETLVYREDVFRLDFENEDNVNENELISEIVNILKPYKNQINASSDEISIGLSLYPDGYHYCISLSPQTLSLLNDLEIELKLKRLICRIFMMEKSINKKSLAKGTRL